MISISLPGRLSPRAREPKRAAWRTPRAQGGFVLPQFGDDLLFVYKSYHINPA
jgi:hypothetical protein